MVGLGTKKLMCLGLLVAGCVRGADTDQKVCSSSVKLNNPGLVEPFSLSESGYRQDTDRRLLHLEDSNGKFEQVLCGFMDRVIELERLIAQKIKKDIEELKIDLGDFSKHKEEYGRNKEKKIDGSWAWSLARQSCDASQRVYAAGKGIEDLNQRFTALENMVGNYKKAKERYELENGSNVIGTALAESWRRIVDLEARLNQIVQGLGSEAELDPEEIASMQVERQIPETMTNPDETNGASSLNNAPEGSEAELHRQEIQRRDRWIGVLAAALGYKYKPEFTNAYNGAANSRLGNFVGTGCNKVGGISTEVVAGIGSFFSRFVPTKVAHVGGKFIDSHAQGLNIAGVVTGISFMGHAAYKNYNQPVEAIEENWDNFAVDTPSALSSSSNNNNNNNNNTRTWSPSLTKDKELSGFQLKKTLLSKEFIAGGLLTTVSALNLTGHTDARNTALLIGGAALAAKAAVDCGPQACSWVKAKLN